MTKIFLYASMILIAIVTFALVGYYYRIIFPPKVIDFKSVSLDNQEYRPGDTVVFTLNYCKYIDLVGQHTLTLEGGSILPVYSDFRSLPMGCHTAIYPVTLVAVTPVGKYHLSLRIDYMLRYIFFAGSLESYQISSENFNVVK